MSASVEVPTALIAPVREGLIHGIGDVAEELTHLVELPDREQNPQRFDVPFGKLELIRARLATLGWGESDPDMTVRVELDAHGQALTDALDAAVVFANDEVEDADDVDRERAKRNETPTRSLKERRAGALRELRASLKRARDGELAEGL